MRRWIFYLIRGKKRHIGIEKNLVLQNAFSFFECAQNNICGVRIIYISSVEIENFSAPLMEKWKEELPNIPGIQKTHFFSCDENLQIKKAITALSAKSNI